MKNSYVKLLLIVLSVLAFSSCKSTKGVAKKAMKAYTPAGNWDYTVSGIPDGDVSGTLVLMDGAEGMTGRLETDGGSVDLEDVSLADNILSAVFAYQGTDVKLKGTFVGEKFTGFVEAQGYEFPITAERKP